MKCICGSGTRVRDTTVLDDGATIVRGRRCVNSDCYRTYITFEKRVPSTQSTVRHIQLSRGSAKGWLTNFRSQLLSVELNNTEAIELIGFILSRARRID